MNRFGWHVLAVVVGWMLEHPFAPVVFLFCFAAWAWWLALFANLEPRETRARRRPLFRG